MGENNYLGQLVNCLNRILMVIEYEGDRSDFIDKFVNLVIKETFIRLADSSEVFTQKAKSLTNYEEMKEIILNHFDDSQIKKMYSDVTKASVMKYYKAVFPTLNNIQKDEVEKILFEFNIPD